MAYFITKVKYQENSNHTKHISQVLIGEPGYYGLSNVRIVLREEVVGLIESNLEVYTFNKNGYGQPVIAKVEVVAIYGRKYIKTVKDETEADNLGELPEFN